jgi:hypothetical protein
MQTASGGKVLEMRWERTVMPSDVRWKTTAKYHGLTGTPSKFNRPKIAVGETGK